MKKEIGKFSAAEEDELNISVVATNDCFTCGELDIHFSNGYAHSTRVSILKKDAEELIELLKEGIDNLNKMEAEE